MKIKIEVHLKDENIELSYTSAELNSFDEILNLDLKFALLELKEMMENEFFKAKVLNKKHLKLISNNNEK